MFKQRFRYPTKLWLALSLGVFCYLFFRVPVEMKGNQPTAYQVCLSGNSEELHAAWVFWLLIAFAVSAFAACIFGILRGFFPVKAPFVDKLFPSQNS